MKPSQASAPSASKAVSALAEPSELSATELAFLEFLDREMAAHPESITPVDEVQLDRIKALVSGVTEE